MKNTLDMMKDIIDATYRQIEDSLPSGEYLLSRLTVYDTRNGLSANIFLTNQAIFLQESNELEKLKKRRFEKINDVKLTTKELYIEFINGYTIVGDVTSNLEEAQRFFNCIRSNTTIKASSTEDLNSSTEIETKPIERQNRFLDTKPDNSARPEELVGVLKPTEEMPEQYVSQKPKKKKKKTGLKILIIILILLLIGGGTVGGVYLYKSNKAKQEEKAKIALVQARADELLKYQLANNELYDYIFELQSQYDEISTNTVSLNLSEVESTFGDLEDDFEKKYSKEFKSKSQVSAIYEVSKIDEWMNENKKLVANVFDIFEECLDSNFKNETRMIELSKALEEADSNIRKVEDILAEEKEGVKKALAKMKGETYKPPKENEQSTKTTDKTKENTTEDESSTKEETTEEKKTDETTKKDTKEEDDDGFIDEDEAKEQKTSKEKEGRDDSPAFSQTPTDTNETDESDE